MARPDTTLILKGEGWLTPNTYSKHYGSIPDGPGIYAFIIFPEIHLASVIGYVGKSKKLSQRLSGHQTLRAIYEDNPGVYVQKWFREASADEITQLEKETIRRFDPPYNIIYRKRGFGHGAHQNN